MREVLYTLYGELKKNNKNTICFYRNSRRIEKTFHDFSADVDQALSRLNHLDRASKINSIALLGPTSYDWIVCDMACIKGGFLTVAIGEYSTENEVLDILRQTSTEIILVDASIAKKYDLHDFVVYAIECAKNEDNPYFWSLPACTDVPDSHNKILEQYSIVFSSGTSSTIKYIKRAFPYIEGGLESLGKGPWPSKNARLIIFMPFSHPQQRDLFRTALLFKVDIVLSDSVNYMKHIILERPNLMVATPAVYHPMACRIREKIRRFHPIQMILFNIFNSLKINSLANDNILKRLFSAVLFKEIKKIYGGRADYFVTGSAPISIETLNVFHSVGVKLFQAYGQTETGTISINTPENFKLGSVGKPRMEVSISSDSEILVKYDHFAHDHNKDVFCISEDAFIHTGDLGYIDKEGYLFITGRKDDVIVLDTGKKVFPDRIESLLTTSGVIKNACVFLGAMGKLRVVLNCEQDIATEEIRKEIAFCNDKLPAGERIAGFCNTEVGFSQENGFLTSTLKKKRDTIKKRFECETFTSV